jgi:hypothetical protein
MSFPVHTRVIATNEKGVAREGVIVGRSMVRGIWIYRVDLHDIHGPLMWKEGALKLAPSSKASPPPAGIFPSEDL